MPASESIRAVHVVRGTGGTDRGHGFTAGIVDRCRHTSDTRLVLLEVEGMAMRGAIAHSGHPSAGGATGTYGRAGRGTMTSELDVYRSAKLWLERHGDAAVAEARRMVEAMRQRADPSGAYAWLRIIVAIEELQHTQLRPGEAMN